MINKTELNSLYKHLGSFNEKGANLFVSSESANMCFFKKLGDHLFFQFGFTPDNYPAIESGVIEISDEELIDHIQKKCEGWKARKCSLDVPLDESGCVMDKANQ